MIRNFTKTSVNENNLFVLNIIRKNDNKQVRTHDKLNKGFLDEEKIIDFVVIDKLTSDSNMMKLNKLSSKVLENSQKITNPNNS